MLSARDQYEDNVTNMLCIGILIKRFPIRNRQHDVLGVSRPMMGKDLSPQRTMGIYLL